MAISVQGMDHSDFCPGYKVPGDIPSELEESVSTEIIGKLVGSWIEL